MTKNHKNRGRRDLTATCVHSTPKCDGQYALGVYKLGSNNAARTSYDNDFYDGGNNPEIVVWVDRDLAEWCGIASRGWKSSDDAATSSSRQQAVIDHLLKCDPYLRQVASVPTGSFYSPGGVLMYGSRGDYPAGVRLESSNQTAAELLDLMLDRD
jgi:hypothetical protein